jgi:hypothetical protein
MLPGNSTGTDQVLIKYENVTILITTVNAAAIVTACVKHIDEDFNISILRLRKTLNSY